MRERPILFSGPMVRAILAGQKTQTRRIVKPQPDIVQPGPIPGAGISAVCTPDDQRLGRLGKIIPCPYGQPGDRLWVRESFRFAASLDPLAPSACADKCLDAGYRTPWAPTQYEADGQRVGRWHGFDTPPVVTEPGKLRASIHMPRFASRILLEIVSVRVQRLQAITEADARAEGVDFDPGDGGTFWVPGFSCASDSAADAFRLLWRSINGDGSWAADPCVWAVEFRRINHDLPTSSVDNRVHNQMTDPRQQESMRTRGDQIKE